MSRCISNWSQETLSRRHLCSWKEEYLNILSDDRLELFSTFYFPVLFLDLTTLLEYGFILLYRSRLLSGVSAGFNTVCISSLSILQTLSYSVLNISGVFSTWTQLQRLTKSLLHSPDSAWSWPLSC